MFPSDPDNSPPTTSSHTIHDVWLASRRFEHKGEIGHLTPGAHRQFSLRNAYLAYEILRVHTFEMFRAIWVPRTSLVFLFNLCRGVFPAFRGYSQALIIDELHSLIASRSFTWARLLRLLATECARMLIESGLDTFATNNEHIVQSSARFLIEYRQMEKRLQLDVPSLSDPVTRDLFQESDLFVRSFSGMTSLGLLSPFDFVSMLTLTSEIISHLYVISTLTNDFAHIWILLFSLASALLPFILPLFHTGSAHPDSLYTPQEAQAAERQEKMRHLAHNDAYRSELLLFGFGPWILESWAQARKSLLGLEKPNIFRETAFLGQVSLNEIMVAVQHIPLVIMMQSSSATLGSFTLYRTSIQSLVCSIRNLINMARLAFQGVFLMGAFCCAMAYEPKLEPKEDVRTPYKPTKKGMKIEARNLSYKYPGDSEPTLKNISFKLEAGESLAIVGCNGSGKSTLAQVLLRIFDFDGGELLINDVPIQHYQPFELHSHMSAVFQTFSKHSGTARENIAVGYVQDFDSPSAIMNAARLARAAHIIDSMPDGLETKLDASGFYSSPCFTPGTFNGFAGERPSYPYHGLSGGEWQRIAISRAFMRAKRPEVDLLVFDEPTSALDAHAQNDIFDTIDDVSRLPSGERVKTVIWITHRLTTARRADKIAMIENGTITEFGTHAQLLAANGSYAALYQAYI